MTRTVTYRLRANVAFYLNAAKYVEQLVSCQLDECHSDEYLFFPLRRTPLGRIPLRRNYSFLKKFKDHRLDHTLKVLIGLNVFMLCLLL